MEPSRWELEQLAIIKILRTIEDEIPGFDARFNAVVAGSASMVMHRLDRGKQIGDIDLFVTTETWFRMQQSGLWSSYITSDRDDKRRHDPPFLYRKFRWSIEGVDTMEVNVFFEWRTREWGNIDVKTLFEEAREIDKILCVSMPWLLEWKQGVQRPKDLPDIELIEELVD